MRIKAAGLLVAVLVLFGAVSAFAHHGFAVEFDASKCMNPQGHPHWNRLGKSARLRSPGRQGRQRKDGTVAPGNDHSPGTEEKRHHQTGLRSGHEQAHGGQGLPDQRRWNAVPRGAAEFIELADGMVRVTEQLVRKTTTRPVSTSERLRTELARRGSRFE